MRVGRNGLYYKKKYLTENPNLVSMIYLDLID